MDFKKEKNMKSMKNKIIITLLVVVCSLTSMAQVGIGTTTPNASAKLDITSTNKGFLPPRVTLTGTADVTTIASPAAGLMVYNTATAGTSPSNVSPGLYYFDGSSWQRINTPSSTSPSVPTWNSLTPTISATTTAPTLNTDRLSLNWRMIGPKEMECVFVINTTTQGNNGNGDYLIQIPVGYNINTSLDFQKAYTGGVNVHDLYGFWRYGIPGGVGRLASSNGYGNWDIVPIVYDANYIRLVILTYGGTIQCWGSSRYGAHPGMAITARFTLTVL